MLRPGIEPVISFTGARDYARSAVASWTNDVTSAAVAGRNIVDLVMRRTQFLKASEKG